MKKTFLKATFIAFVSLSWGISANAQISISNILKGVTSSDSSTTSSSSDSSGSSIISSLVSIFSSDKQASTSTLVGTWSYSEPSIIFESDNLLTQAGAKVAANSLAEKLQTQLSRFGIDEGAMSFIFNTDGSFTETINSKTLSGTWTVEDSTLKLTYSSLNQSISVTTQLSGSNLMLVTDASKLLTLFKTIGNNSSISSLSTITSLMENIDGMQVGITLVKQ